MNSKVNFMEPIVISLIYRKALNYGICKLLEKYKKQIQVKVTYNLDNEPSYKIIFIDSVNNIGIKELNNLLDIIFDKKSVFNENSHLVHKNKPAFISDVWFVVKQNLNLKSKELIAFNALIIKMDFNLMVMIYQYLNTLNKIPMNLGFRFNSLLEYEERPSLL